MTKATLDFIHRSYQEALALSDNIIEILENLFRILDNAEVCDEDTEAYDAFIDGLRGCIQIRKKTFVITNAITYINIAIMYIVHWLNSTQNMHYDLVLTTRRKSLRSDLRKILEKANDNPSISANIRDRFGLRASFKNDFSEEEAIQHINMLFDAITGILAGKNRKMKKAFIEWFESNDCVPVLDKDIIRNVLAIPFFVDSIKDYVTNPKDNGYQALHFTMFIPMYSDIVPGGTQFEIQIRSKDMDDIAESGTADHMNYKKAQKFDDIFLVDDFSSLHIPGFTGCDSKQQDHNGIHFEKKFFDRRISLSLVP